jgi:DNA helicase-2/ATP-dependent DNA helicase PcrA
LGYRFEPVDGKWVMNDLCYSLFADLNPPQREAVEHIDGPLLILAGAGSGKTRVLAARAAHLVHSGATRPYQILALTFTNKAAGELKSRVESMVGADGKMVVAGTFHGIFARLLRQEGLNIGVDPHYTIVDEDDKRRLIKAILKEMGLTSEIVRPAEIEWLIERAKDELLTPEDFARRIQYPSEQIAAEVYKRYQGRLKRMSGLDFGDLLMRPMQAFQAHPEFLRRLQNRFRFVMVDEFQDTNRVQYLLVSEIAKLHRNLCVVGDDDQAIYGFRGATVENILHFHREWSDARVIKLEQNYRSTKPILDVAWAVIHHNHQRHAKKLWTKQETGAPVELMAAVSDEDEALRMVGLIQDEHNKKQRPYSQFAVLYRTNAQSLSFERALRAAQMPYQVVGGLRFYERKEVKDILAYLRLIINPSDDVSFLRVVNYPPRGIGETVVNELQSRARADAAPLSEALSRLLSDNKIADRRRNALKKFSELMEGFRKLAAAKPAAEWVGELVERAGLKERLQQEEKDDLSRAESKLANIGNLVNEIIRYFETTPDAALEGFLEEVALVTNVDEYDDQADKVNLLTLHNSKGLEFPVVFIGGLEEGLLPLEPPDGSPAEVEEERRLFYVGATRAMERLVLGFAASRMLWGNSRWAKPSRFIAEIPAHLLQSNFPPYASRGGVGGGDWEEEREKGRKGESLPRLRGGARGGESGNESERVSEWASKRVSRIPQSAISDQPSAVSNQQSGFSNQDSVNLLNLDEIRKGLLVRHRTFGLGVVVDFKKRGVESRIEVDFDDVGQKTLIYKFAKLEAVRP